MQLDLESRISLGEGVEIPRLGLGVFRSASGDETRRAVSWALELGYRHIDTARIYGNEADVGAAIRESGLPREDIFITTKLWNTDHGRERALRAVDESLEMLGVDQLDLFLIHWPVEDLRNETWNALQKVLELGKVRALGVSNFMIHHLEELIAYTSIVPAVNQVELSPFLTQNELVRFCRGKDIELEAYSPLTKGLRLDDPTVSEIASRVGKTAAQVMIRWSLQRGFVVLPKSVRRERIAENADVYDFVLTADDMGMLDGLNEDLHTGWNPTSVP